MQFLDNSLHIWRVWKANVRISVIREMEFRANFLLGIIRQILWLSIFILMIKTVFQNTDSLAGWRQSEVLIILALSRLIEGILNTLFTHNIGQIPQIVQSGRFDFVLNKPIPAQFYAAFRRFKVDSLGNVIAGLALLLYALTQLEVVPSVFALLLFCLLAFVGITIFYSLLILVASLVFFLERLESVWAFMNIFSEPLTVPFDIFPRTPRIALTYLLPLAFVVFVPAQAITGRLDWWQVPVGIILAGIFLLLANLAWRAGLRHYSSASS
jgi:ABC-2 type transport system permease protein